MTLQTQLSSMKNQAVEVIPGIQGYIKAVTLKVEMQPKLIRQIINQDLIVPFHQASHMLVKDIIKRRVEYHIPAKHLITFGDIKMIEKSDAATFKEVKMLPKSVRFNLMLTTFGNYTTITTLDSVETSVTYILSDPTVKESLDNVFEALWQISTEA